ncbi:MAG: cysteine desulfurase [Gemmatimonadetes bacterium]|nr:cysteine desulfurase [Gemmatimonadota bacterium]
MRSIYLNNAATSYPKPASVIEAVAAALAALPGSPGRGGGGGDDPVRRCRGRVARFLGVRDPARLIFTSGATESLNLVVRGLPLAGRRLVTTAADHNSVLRPLHRLHDETGATIEIVPVEASGRVSLDALRAAIDSDTALVAVPHGSNVTGHVLDIAALALHTRSLGVPLLVDAAQTAGALPIDVDAWGIDYFAFTGHKSMLGTQGTGGLVASGPLVPLKVGGTGVLSQSLAQPRELPLRFEAGTPNAPGLVALEAGVAWIEGEGIDSLHRRKMERAEQLRRGLEAIDKVRLIGRPGELPVFCFVVDGVPVDELGQVLEESFGVHTRAGLHCAPLIHDSLGANPQGSIRVSPSAFTTVEEIEAALAAVDTVARSW